MRSHWIGYLAIFCCFKESIFMFTSHHCSLMKVQEAVCLTNNLGQISSAKKVKDYEKARQKNFLDAHQKFRNLPSWEACSGMNITQMLEQMPDNNVSKFKCKITNFLRNSQFHMKILLVKGMHCYVKFAILNNS